MRYGADFLLLVSCIFPLACHLHLATANLLATYSPPCYNRKSMSNDNNNPAAAATDLFRSHEERDITVEMEESYLDYAMSVIVSRALPDARDGLKPVHRRILFAMARLGLRSGASFRKSSAVVGEVLAKYHPHGDSPVYEAMVRMAQPFSLREPLVRGQGNFGSLDGDNAAAMRYTEAKLEKIADLLLEDLDKDTVDFRENYDGTQKEPTVLPSRLPNLLLNGATGIAVGMATSIPPHNLGELLDAVLYLSANPDATVEDLMQFVQGPDFPTGAMAFDRSAIRAAYETGRASIPIRARADIEETGKKSRIVITEIPYLVNKSNLVAKMADVIRDRGLTGVSDLRDESSREGVRIVVDLKMGAFPQKILNQLYRETPLQTTFPCNFISLEDGQQPRLLGLVPLLAAFLGHRHTVVRRRTEFELRAAREREHILEGLSKALDHIDEIIETIRQSDTKEEAGTALRERFDFSVAQSDAILAMRLSALAGLERKKITDELAERRAFIARCEEILGSEDKLRTVVEDELKEIREQFATPRRTEIFENAIGKFRALDTIPNVPAVVMLTTGGYVKRCSPESFRAQNRGGKGLKGGAGAKTGEEIAAALSTRTHANLLVFTSAGRVLPLAVHEIPEASRTARGRSAINFLPLEQDEDITEIFENGKQNAENLFFITNNGVVKKTPFAAFQNIRRNGIRALTLREGDRLSWVRGVHEGSEVMLVTRHGASIRFSEADVRAMGRGAAGVRGIRLREGDTVVSADIVEDASTAKLLVVMENGLGKASPVDAFRKQTRGGTGVKCANLTKKTGLLAGAAILEEQFSGDLLFITASGQTLRTPASEIPARGRATQGVILMRPAEGDRVSGVLRLSADSEESAPEATQQQEGLEV